MKNKNGFNYLRILATAITTELTLIAVQFVYLEFYVGNSGGALAFTPEYMRSTGFYVFQIIGFFLYTAIVYIVLGKINNKVLNKITLLVAVGGMIELTFYMTMIADYQGVYLYSVLDKIIAAVFGIILFNYTIGRKKKPDSYL